MEWTLTDRANRVGLIILVLIAAGAITPILLGSTSLPLMAIVALTIVAIWRLSLARWVVVVIDRDGISKTLGAHTWRLDWDQVTSAGFTRFFGSDQLLLVSERHRQQHWSGSDRLYNLASADSRAVQVPARQLSAVKELLVARGLLEH